MRSSTPQPEEVVEAKEGDAKESEVKEDVVEEKAIEADEERTETEVAEILLEKVELARGRQRTENATYAIGLARDYLRQRFTRSNPAAAVDVWAPQATIIQTTSILRKWPHTPPHPEAI